MKRALLISLLFLLSFTTPVFAQEENPWDEVFLPDGELNPELIDLGITSEHPDWMSMDLPFGQTIQMDANYHRYQTPSGNLVVMPSASTLFFMALNPQESGLSASIGSVSNGFGSVITFMSQVVGDNLDWEKIQEDHPEYNTPEQFWDSVLNGSQDAWTYFTGWSFITTLLQMSWSDGSLRSLYLLYQNGVLNCSSVPGACSGIVTPPTPQRECPEPNIVVQQPQIKIQKSTPNYPLVSGQDTENRRGVDILANVSIPPVFFTWFEPIYEDEEICEVPETGGLPVCRIEAVFKECREHIEHLPDRVVSLQATASLDGSSQSWILNNLGQTHYEAYIHQSAYALIPGYGVWSGGCDAGGTCLANGQALQVPITDPGTFNLHLEVVTSGTSFQGISITQPRNLSAVNTFQVYVTLPALVQ